MSSKYRTVCRAPRCTSSGPSRSWWRRKKNQAWSQNSPTMICLRFRLIRVFYLLIRMPNAGRECAAGSRIGTFRREHARQAPNYTLSISRCILCLSGPRQPDTLEGLVKSHDQRPILDDVCSAECTTLARLHGTTPSCRFVASRCTTHRCTGSSSVPGSDRVPRPPRSALPSGNLSAHPSVGHTPSARHLDHQALGVVPAWQGGAARHDSCATSLGVVSERVDGRRRLRLLGSHPDISTPAQPGRACRLPERGRDRGPAAASRLDSKIARVRQRTKFSGIIRWLV